MHSLDKRFLNEIKRVLPSHTILLSEEQRKPYECDGLSGYRALPGVVLLPDTVDAVQKILALCQRYQIPVVARGAGTGLSGGATPHPEGVLLSMARFNQVLSIDQVAATARVQPGVRNLAISEAVADFGLYYAPDPSSQIACTIGGNVAENAGGVHCLKYGLTVHNVVSAQVVLMGGEILEIGGEALDNPGYDLLAAFVGSEGMLGVVTEVTVRLLPRPIAAKALMSSFDSTEEAAAAVARIIAEGIIPAGLEMMDNPAIVAAEDFVSAGYPRDAAAILLCELDGGIEEVETDVATVSRFYWIVVRSTFVSRRMNPSARVSGRVAKMLFRRWGEFRPIIIVSTARSRAGCLVKSWPELQISQPNTSLRSQTFFMLAMATFIP